MQIERVITLDKLTIEISNIHSDEELNNLTLFLNEHEQVSHLKIYKNTITFNCIDMEVLVTSLYQINKEIKVQQVVDGKKREYDFVQNKETKCYFMFKNLLTEDDIHTFVKQIENNSHYKDIHYDTKNELLILTSDQRDTLSSLRNELFKINPSIEILEHNRPIRSEDVFNQKYLKTYARIAIFVVAIALAFIFSKDHSVLAPVCWGVAVILISENLFVNAFKKVRQKRILDEDVLVAFAFIITIATGYAFETAIASILYQLAAPLLNKVLERSLYKIDKAVEMPETGYILRDGEEELVSLYEFKVGDTLIVQPGDTIHMPGTVLKGPSLVNTYSHTSTYEEVKVKKGSQVHSGYINVGKKPIYIKINKAYDSSNFMKLMDVASVAPVYESKIEKYTKILSKYYTPFVALAGIVIAIFATVINVEEYSQYAHVGAVCLVLSGALSSSQSTSLGILAGFAKAFKSGIVVESSIGLDSINATQTIVYDRFDGQEVTDEELELFKKLSRIGRTLVIFNDGPVALENDQYTIFNDLTVKEKLQKMDSLIGPIVYIGDSFKDIALLQKSFVGISRGGLADAKVVENSDIVLIDADLNKVYETFLIARKMRSQAIVNSVFTIFMKIALLITITSFTALPIWVAILIEMIVSASVMYNSTRILE